MTTILLLIAVFAVFLVLRLPVAFAMGLASLVTLFAVVPAQAGVLVTRAAVSTDSFVLIAIPLFIVAGAYMETGGISQRLVGFATALVGHVRGSLGMILVVSEMFFSGISGSTVADVSAMSSMMLPAMKRAGYKQEYSVSIVAASSAMGMLIPPCINMVVLGALVNISVAALFLAGFLPAVVLAAFIMGLMYVQATSLGLPAGERASLRHMARTFLGALIPLGMPIIIFGGIFGGVFSPTEAAAVAVLYAIVVGTLVYRELNLRNIFHIAIQAGVTASTVVLLMALASTFSYLMATNHLPQAMLVAISSVSKEPWFFLIVANLIFIFVGSILEGLPALIIFAPILYPVAMQLGIHPIHFGILAIAAVGIGLFIPPAGVGLIIACAMGKITMGQVIRPLTPFMIVLFIGLGVLTFVPWFSTIIPELVMGR